MIIEGIAVPYGGQLRGNDTFGTHFSARSDLHLDLLPDGGPLLYQHGFDASVGMTPVGRWTVAGRGASGLSIRATLDPTGAFYDPLCQLLAARVLGFSAGSAEHSIRIDQRSGEILDWPLWEVSLTPTPSNTYARVISATPGPVAGRGAVQPVALTVRSNPEPMTIADFGRLQADTAARAAEAGLAVAKRLTGWR